MNALNEDMPQQDTWLLVYRVSNNFKPILAKAVKEEDGLIWQTQGLSYKAMEYDIWLEAPCVPVK